MLLAVSAASVSAQTYQIRKDSVKTGEYSPTVYLVSVNAPQPPADEEALLEAAVLNQLAIDNAIRDYIETHHPGFQQDELPHFIFATKQNKFSFSLGGQVTLRASYDFDGISGAQDFIPATIAVPGTYATRQKFGLDGTTSRIFLKAIANSKKLGRVTLYFSTDFRGGGTNSYTPRIRSAYVSFKGFTFGRDVTTFCDLNAAPNTIDFQGPNAYNYFFSTMIRYEHSIYRDILKFGVAAELPNVSGTYGDSFASIPQRVPDFPVYMQVNWGRNKESHFRASAVFRDMYLHNESTGNNTSLFGWGVQASGNIKVAGPLQLFFNGVYGEGITPYIQDLSGIGLDLHPILTIRGVFRLCRCTVGRRLRKSTSFRTNSPFRAVIPWRRFAAGTGPMPMTNTVAVSMSSAIFLGFGPLLSACGRIPVRHPRKYGRNEGPCQSGQSDGALQLLISEGGIFYGRLPDAAVRNFWFLRQM